MKASDPILDEVEIETHVLLEGETILWSRKSSIPKEAKNAVIISLSLSVLFIILMFVCSKILGSLKPFLVLAFISPALLMVVIGGNIYWKNSGDNINILTNFRVINCMLKRGRFVRTQSAPYGFIDSVDSLIDSVVFQMRPIEYNSSVEDEERVIPAHTKVIAIKFENVKDPNEVENIARKYIIAEKSESNTGNNKDTSSETSYFDSSSISTVTYNAWPASFIKLRDTAILYSRDDPNTLVEDTSSPIETVVWSYKASLWVLWKQFIFILVSMEIFLIILSIVIKSGLIFLFGSIIFSLSVYLSLNFRYMARQAYAFTTKGILLFRSGFPSLIQHPPDIIFNDNFNHCIRIPFEFSYPIVAEMSIKNGSGEIWFIGQQTNNIKMFVPKLT